MAKQNINVGTAANDKKGDSLRAAFQKVNANFTELYTALGLNSDGTLNLGAFEFAGSTLSTTDSTAIVIDQATTITSNLTVGGDIVPSIANGGDLGSAAKPWKSLYVSGSTIYLGNAALSVDANGELLINDNRILQDNGNYISLNLNVNDVQVSDLQVGDTLQWAGGFWVNGPEGGGVSSYNDLTDKPTLFSGSYNDLTDKPNNIAGTYQFFVAADDSTQRLISTDELIKFTGAGGITTASDAEGNITISKISELISVTVPTIGSTASAGEAGITYLTGGLSKWAIFTEGAFTVGVWTDVQPGWTVTDNNGFTDTIAGRGSFGAASFQTTVNNWPSPASGKTYVFTSPDYQLGYTNPIEITVGDNDWTFGTDGALTTPGNITLPNGSVIKDTDYLAVAFGSGAGTISQGFYAVAVGSGAGYNGQGNAAVAIGSDAGGTSQGLNAVAVGAGAGSTGQGINAVAIGIQAGYTNQGANAVAIGIQAGETAQAANSIILNATGATLNQTTANTFTVKPVRQDETADAMYYNSSTGEITYADAFSFSVAGDDSTQRLISSGELIKFIGAGGITTASDDEGNITITGSGGGIPLAGAEYNLNANAYLAINTTDGAIDLLRNGVTGIGIREQGLHIYAANSYILWDGSVLKLPVASDIQRDDGFGNFVSVLGGSVSSLVNGAQTASLGSDGSLTIPGDIKSNSNINIDINLSDSTLHRWSFGEDGELTLPGGRTRIGTAVGVDAIIANEDEVFGVVAQGTNGAVQLVWIEDLENVYTSNLAAVYVNSGGPGSVRIATGANGGPGPNYWEFNNSGALTLPNGSTIGDGEAGVGVPITTARGTILLGNLAECAGGESHFHIMKAGQQAIDLFLGDDSNYVKLPSTGGVEISSSEIGAQHYWTFGTDGSLRIPGDIKSDGNINIDINLSDSTLRRWQFGEDGILTVPGPISGLGNAKLDFTTYGANTAYLTTTSNDTTALIMGTASAELYAQTNILIRTNTDETAKVWTFGDDGSLTFPNGVLKIAGNTISNYVAGDDGGSGSQLEVSQTKTVITNGVTNSLGEGGPSLISQHLFEVSTNGILSAFQVINTLGEGESTLTSELITELDNNSFKIGQRITNDLGDGSEPLVTFNGWTFGIEEDNITLAITFPDGTTQTTAAEAFSFNVAADDSTQRAISNNELIKFVGAGGVTTASDEEGNITITGGGSVALPVCVINSSSNSVGGIVGGVSVNFTVTNPSGAAISEIGIFLPSVDTAAAATVADSAAAGTQDKIITAPSGNTRYWAQVYAVTPNGTAYSAPNYLTATHICLLAGTMIAMADGTHKAIEDITYTDRMLSWDFDRGCYAETTALWIKQAETGSQYNLLTFSDGTTLRTFDQHRIFNKQAGAFTYPMTDATPIGTITVNEHGEEITLIDKQVVVDTIEYYNVITDHHMNLFSDTILTSCRFNNIYPILDMKFVKDSRMLRTRDEFENIPDRFFYGLRLAEQTYELDMIEWYVTRLLSVEQSFELAAV